jgi:hypothetical protein
VMSALYIRTNKYSNLIATGAISMRQHLIVIVTLAVLATAGMHTREAMAYREALTYGCSHGNPLTVGDASCGLSNQLGPTDYSATKAWERLSTPEGKAESDAEWERIQACNIEYDQILPIRDPIAMVNEARCRLGLPEIDSL